MECPICYEVFPSNTMIGLSCNHSICKDCCANMVLHGVCCEGENILKCPMCRGNDENAHAYFYGVFTECKRRLTEIISKEEEHADVRRNLFKEYIEYILQHKWFLSQRKVVREMTIQKCKELNDEDGERFLEVIQTL